MQQEIRPLLAVDIIEQLHRQFAMLSGKNYSELFTLRGFTLLCRIRVWTWGRKWECRKSFSICEAVHKIIQIQFKSFMLTSKSWTGESVISVVGSCHRLLCVFQKLLIYSVFSHVSLYNGEINKKPPVSASSACRKALLVKVERRERSVWCEVTLKEPLFTAAVNRKVSQSVQQTRSVPLQSVKNRKNVRL